MQNCLWKLQFYSCHSNCSPKPSSWFSSLSVISLVGLHKVQLALFGTAQQVKHLVPRSHGGLQLSSDSRQLHLPFFLSPSVLWSDSFRSRSTLSRWLDQSHVCNRKRLDHLMSLKVCTCSCLLANPHLQHKHRLGGYHRTGLAKETRLIVMQISTHYTIANYDDSL